MKGYDRIEHIRKPNIIFCEGNDECYFLIYMLEYLCRQDKEYEAFEVKNFGGVNELSRQLKLLKKMPGFDDVKSLIIIRDAEKDFNNAKKEIYSSLNNNELPVPLDPGEICEKDGLKVAYLLFPSLDDCGNKNGTLEDFCLELINKDDKDVVLGDIDEFLDQEHDMRDIFYPRRHKNRLHTYISLYDEYVSCKVGEAGKIGLYDWESTNLDYFKDLMKRMC